MSIRFRCDTLNLNRPFPSFFRSRCHTRLITFCIFSYFVLLVSLSSAHVFLTLNSSVCKSPHETYLISHLWRNLKRGTCGTNETRLGTGLLHWWMTTYPNFVSNHPLLHRSHSITFQNETHDSSNLKIKCLYPSVVSRSTCFLIPSQNIKPI